MSTRNSTNSNKGKMTKVTEERFAEMIQWEMNALLDFVKWQDQKIMTYFKVSIGVFSLFITGLVAIFTLGQRAGTLGDNYPFDLVLWIVLFCMGLINLVIVKQISAIHAGRISAIRQANNFRRALDSAVFTLLEGKQPESVDDLKNEDTDYWNAFGCYRVLPLDDRLLQEHHRYFGKSAEDFMVLVISFLTAMVLIAPLVYFGFTGSAFISYGSGATTLTFLIGISWVLMDSRKMIRSAIFANSPNNGNSGLVT